MDIERLTKRYCAAAACAVLASCGGSGSGSGFEAGRDFGRVAQCYAAFASISIDAADPALGYSGEQQVVQKQVALMGLTRLTPFIARARPRAGGDKALMSLVAAWRKQRKYDVAGAGSPDDKRAAYQAVLGVASGCQATLNGWGAARNSNITSPITPPAES